MLNMETLLALLGVILFLLKKAVFLLAIVTALIIIVFLIIAIIILVAIILAIPVIAFKAIKGLSRDIKDAIKAEMLDK